jgi:hypothetical protein
MRLAEAGQKRMRGDLRFEFGAGYSNHMHFVFDHSFSFCCELLLVAMDSSGGISLFSSIIAI